MFYPLIVGLNIQEKRIELIEQVPPNFSVRDILEREHGIPCYANLDNWTFYAFYDEAIASRIIKYVSPSSVEKEIELKVLSALFSVLSERIYF